MIPRTWLYLSSSRYDERAPSRRGATTRALAA